MDSDNVALNFLLSMIEVEQDIQDTKMDSRYPEYNMFYRIGLE